MKITIESTTKVIQLNGVPARIWEGVTDKGLPVHCYVTRIAIPEGREAGDYADFERELAECRQPSPAIEAIPLRLIL